ncbi:MAG: hypothetical protein IJX88_03760 [Clostridia bacterium]|nr:hypothetical protein [Clostridia bacterium]
MDVTFDFETKKPFPDEDYKNGRLKAVRGRILKKLMKYEFKALLPGLWIALSVLLCATVVMSIAVRSLGDKVNLFTALDSPATPFLLLAILLYMYSIMGVIFTPIIIAEHRYQKNFFKEEGYLTFSIPASAEEHLFAKHLSAMITTFAAMVASLISILLVVIITSAGTSTPAPDTETSSNVLSTVFGIIEAVILSVEVLAAMFCVSGALCAWGQKFTKKGQIVLRVIIAFVVLSVLDAVIALIDVLSGYGFTLFFATEIGEHVGALIWILLLALIIVLSFLYERKTLKYHLNLK